jgi:hypothetical protein
MVFSQHLAASQMSSSRRLTYNLANGCVQARKEVTRLRWIEVKKHGFYACIKAQGKPTQVVEKDRCRGPHQIAEVVGVRSSAEKNHSPPNVAVEK